MAAPSTAPRPSPTHPVSPIHSIGLGEGGRGEAWGAGCRIGSASGGRDRAAVAGPLRRPGRPAFPSATLQSSPRARARAVAATVAASFIFLGGWVGGWGGCEAAVGRARFEVCRRGAAIRPPPTTHTRYCSRAYNAPSSGRSPAARGRRAGAGPRHQKGLPAHHRFLTRHTPNPRSRSRSRPRAARPWRPSARPPSRRQTRPRC